MNLFDFMAADQLNPLIALLMLSILAHYGFRCWNRLMRHLNVRKAGWPPAHLDADGDFNQGR